MADSEMVERLRAALSKLLDMWTLEAIHRCGDPRHAYFGFGCVHVAMEALGENRADFDRRAARLLLDERAALAPNPTADERGTEGDRT